MQNLQIMNIPSQEMLQDIVRDASRLMRTDFDISCKDGLSNIVTTSDIAVQKYLCGRLTVLLPGSGFICEEEDINDSSCEYTWIIDPIDGTANYSRGIDQCAICVALKHNADIVLGVVYIPATDEMFSACKGSGAYLNGNRISVSSRRFENSILCTALPVYHKEYTDVCSSIIRKAFLCVNDIRRFGACAPELCYLAMGRCELYFEYILSPWDFAAASLILTEAGGVITDLGGNRLTCMCKSGVIAANSMENHQRMADIVCSVI